MKQNAIVFTGGLLDDPHGKTAHGLIRGSRRYHVVAVVDNDFAGQDAGEVLDGNKRGVPVFSDLSEALHALDSKPHVAIVGAAFEGGLLPESWRPLILEALNSQLDVVCGLHQFLSDDEEFMHCAQKNGVRLLDVRRPKKIQDLHFWTGEILQEKTPRVAVLGIDCGLGKRTTSQYLVEECARHGIHAQMIYTGQTGWLQGHQYGFVLDSTPNDFVCGELEHALLSCAREAKPDLMVVEGQSALRNPSGPCGAEYLLSGNIKGIIYQYAPFRECFDGFEAQQCFLPQLVDEIRLIEAYGAHVLAITLNGRGGTPEQLISVQKELQEQWPELPIVRPLDEGLSALIPVLQRYMAKDLT